MATMTAGVRDALVNIYIGMFKAAPGLNDLNSMVASYEAGKTQKQIAADLAVTANFTSVYPTALLNSEFTDELVDYLLGTGTTLIGSTDKAWAVNWVLTKLNAGVSRSEVIVMSVNALAATTNASYDNSKAQLANKLEVAKYYALTQELSSTSLSAKQDIIDGVTNVASSVTTAKTEIDTTVANNAKLSFTLTTAVDNFTGGIGNDTFTADNTTAGQFSAADTLAGGNGTDSLTIYGTSATTVANMSSIENVTVDSMGAGTTWNFAAISGITSLTNTRAAGAATVTVANGTAVTITNNALSTGIQTVNFGATDTAVNLTLNKMVLTGATDLVVSGAAATTLNINTTGAASSIAQKIDGDALMTKLVITGDQNLTIGTAGAAGLEAAIVNVDANAFTGKLAVVTNNTAAGTNLTTAPGLSVTGGSGDDTIDVRLSDAADNVVVVTGAGSNTVKTLNANLTATEKYTGGAGTDTLQVDFADTTATQAVDMSALITGFETLEVVSNASGAQTETLAMATNKLGISNIVWSGDAGDALAITGLAANSTLTVKTAATTIGATIGTDTVADTINVVLDGTTPTGTMTLTSYETVNLTSQKDAALNTNSLAGGGLTASSATSLVLTGAGALVGGTMTLAATAAVNASAYTGDLTATTFTAIKSYSGGTGKDEITLAAGDLKQGNTFAGGAGTDKLTQTAASAQDAGILAVTGFETVVLGTDTGGGDAYKADFRNVTDLTTLTLNSGNDTDTLTLNRLSGDTTVTFNDTFGAVVTTVNTGTSQKLGFSATATVDSVTLDSGTTAVSIATAATFTGTLSALSGTSLATVTVTGAGATTITGALGTSVTKVDASAATGAVTVTASATATTILGGTAVDVITGGNAADTIQGGKGGDTLSGGTGADSYVFESTAALNGSDTITLVAGAGGDVLNFKNFLSGGSLDQNGAAGTAINEYTSANVSDVAIANKVVMYSEATESLIDGADEIAALIQGAGDAFSLASGGKAIMVTGDAAGGVGNETRIWFIDDALDGTLGTIGTADVVLVGITSVAFDVDTLITSNFAFA